MSIRSQPKLHPTTASSSVWPAFAWPFGTAAWLGAVRTLPAILACILALSIWFGLAAAPQARIALIVFALATVAWTMTALDDTLVALAAAAALVASHVVPAQQLHAALGSDLIWLLVGAFVIAAAMRASGLTERLALAVLSPFSRVSSLFLAATGVILATAFVVPSTSGRAALLLPIYLALADAIDDPRINRALALLFPSVILLSAGGSLIGAGAHLVAVEMTVNAARPGFGYLDWMAMGLPFALLASLSATAAILGLFLNREERGRSLRLPQAPREPLTPGQRYVLAVVAVIMLGWSTQALHGLDAAVVTLLGAVVITLKPLAPVSMKQALKSAEWPLILFLAATTLMGAALIETGAASHLMKVLIGALPPDALSSPARVAALVAAVALSSHLLVTSRTARAVVLIPLLALPLADQGYDPRSLIFLIVMGTGFCQTLPVSAKPVALYAGLDRPTYTGRDLARLSLALLPLNFLLLMAFALVFWPAAGMTLLR